MNEDGAKKYQVILADPPWEMGKSGLTGKGRNVPVPYPTMTVDAIKSLPIQAHIKEPCHLWLWTTNRRLHDAYHVIDAWGFKYLNILTYNKPSGVGPWFVNTTQHLLFGYRGKLRMGFAGRYSPTSQYYTPSRHSKKPSESYTLIENVSPYINRLELFARQKRVGWDVWGNEVDSDIELDIR